MINGFARRAHGWNVIGLRTVACLDHGKAFEPVPAATTHAVKQVHAVGQLGRGVGVDST